MVLRFLGESVTDSNGNAVLEDGYTGTGAGLVDIIAQTTIDESTVVSQPYEVVDCIKYDKGNTANTIWTLGNNSNAQLDLVDNSYRKLSEITTGTDAWVYLKIDHSCVCEFDVQVTTTNYGRAFCQYGQSANASTRANITLPSAVQSSNWHHIKLSLQNGVVTMTSDELSNPVTYNLSSYDASMDMYFRFRTDTEITEISFKEFEYYPI